MNFPGGLEHTITYICFISPWPFCLSSSLICQKHLLCLHVPSMDVQYVGQVAYDLFICSFLALIQCGNRMFVFMCV